MRVLVAILMLYAGTAQAAPECADGSHSQPTEILASVTPSDFDASPEDAPAALSTTRGREVLVSLRPELRPCKFRKIALGREQMRQRGALCGDWTILGTTRKPITGKYYGCGIADPVEVRVISDVFLSQLALMDCETAVTFKTWIENTAKPAFADQGGGLKGMRLAGHYSCKTQNNQPLARLSEHARGRAIDISAFVLKDGTIVTVGSGWDAENSREVMRSLHSGACGLFGTVLGPDADRYHKGHFHFDTARRRGGSICR
ncbi:extensin family protein [Ruegeria lacuscaerulensis]|uniref:extensin-like domain-containing protein n=1 Tax=Ruegeria lacuscaerulensis TaxID=55218 RepID=UPI001479F915|nr:extensin family protein [Ruegeria lacuscaerulensis]